MISGDCSTIKAMARNLLLPRRMRHSSTSRGLGAAIASRAWATLPLLASILSIISVSGCIISPQPEPPRIDVDKIRIELISSDPDGGQRDMVRFIGSEGAVTPGGATLSITNLDRPSTNGEWVVAEDGSFSATLPGVGGDMFRLIAWVDALHSEPVDIVAPVEDGAALPAPRPLEDCLELTPPREIDFGETVVSSSAVSALVVRNQCAEAVSLDDVRLASASVSRGECRTRHDACLVDGPVSSECADAAQDCENRCDDEYSNCTAEPAECNAALEECRNGCREERDACVVRVCDEERDLCLDDSAGTGGFVATIEVPLQLESGEARSIIVTFEPESPGRVEEVMVIYVNAPESGRLPITLIGEGVEP